MSKGSQFSPSQDTKRAPEFTYVEQNSLRPPKEQSRLSKCCRCSFGGDPLTLHVAPKGRPTNILEFLLSLNQLRFTSCDVLQTELHSPHAYIPSRFFHTINWTTTTGITLLILFFVYITNGHPGAAPWVIFFVWFVLCFSIFAFHLAKAKTVNLVHWLLKLNYVDSSKSNKEMSILAEFGRGGMQIYHPESWLKDRDDEPDDNPAWYEPIQKNDLSCKFQYGAYERWSVTFHRGSETYINQYSHIFTAEMHRKSDSDRIKKQMFAMLWEYDSTALDLAVLQSRKTGKQSKLVEELIHLNDMGSSPRSDLYNENIQKLRSEPSEKKRFPEHRRLRSQSDPFGTPCLANRAKAAQSLDTPGSIYTPNHLPYISSNSSFAFTPETGSDTVKNIFDTPPVVQAPLQRRLPTVTRSASEIATGIQEKISPKESSLEMHVSTLTEYGQVDIESNDTSIRLLVQQAFDSRIFDQSDGIYSTGSPKRIAWSPHGESLNLPNHGYDDEYSETIPDGTPMFDHRTISLTPSIGRGEKPDVLERVVEMNEALDGTLDDPPLSPVMREFENIVDPFGYNARNKNCQTFVRDIWIMFDYKFRTIFQKRMHYRARYGWYTVSRVLVAASFYLVLFLFDGYIHFPVAVCALTWLTISGDGTRIIGWRLKNYVDELSATEWFLCEVLRIYSHDTPAYEIPKRDKENFPVDHDVESYVFGIKVHWSSFYFAVWVVQFLIVSHKMSTILIPLFIMCRTFHDLC